MNVRWPISRGALVLLLGTEGGCVPADAPAATPPSAVAPDSGISGAWLEGLEIHDGHRASEEEAAKSSIVVEPGPQVGTLPRDAMEAVVRSQQAALQACAATMPELTGNVVVKFVINTEGIVTQAQVARTSIAHPDVEDCLKRTIRAWKFPPPKGGIVITSYGVRFAPANK